MPAYILLFLSGDLFLQTFSHLPGIYFISTLAMAAILLWITLHKRYRYISLPVAFAIGFCWSAWHANSVLSLTLPKEYEGRPLLITGRVTAMPVVSETGTHFNFAVSRISSPYTQHVEKNISLNVRLMWRNSGQHIRSGDERQFLARLKRIHGTQSPGAFDFEAWSLQNGLNATGYVLASTRNILLSHDWYHSPVNQLRQFLMERIQPHLPASPTSPWLLALMFGERNGIPQENWQVLRNTGTNHLMAIAGLHIGMIAGLVHCLVAWLWRRSVILTLWLPATLAGTYAALATAVLYGALAGFSLPAQRACIMLAVYIITLIARQKINPWHSWAMALLSVLLINPLGVLSESFWLSFGTIALIIYGMSGRLSPAGLWWKWFRVQWVVGIGLIPVTLALFQQSSFVSFIANSIAIPWLGFLILPFCLLGGLFVLIIPAIGDILLMLADKSLGLLWWLLVSLAQLQVSSWQHAIFSQTLLMVTVAGFILLLLPAGFPGKWFGLIWILPLIVTKPARPEAGDFDLALLDVGQGLSVIVQTKSHMLVYDAGPRFADAMDMGASVVLPYLQTIDAKQIDMLVVSHGDNDHIGGVRAILKKFSVKWVRTSVPEKLPSPVTDYCFAGSAWQWDGVNFSFLYPTRDNLHLSNDSSCVLRIDNGKQSVLLTGDIEKYAETDLLARIPDQLAVNILIAPHHGSKTSGLSKFVSAVHPQFVLYATGYFNRYHFPHHSVISAYTEIGSSQLDTAKTGTILFKLNKDKALQQPELYRQTHKKYWMIDLL